MLGLSIMCESVILVLYNVYEFCIMCGISSMWSTPLLCHKPISYIGLGVRACMCGKSVINHYNSAYIIRLGSSLLPSA